MSNLYFAVALHLCPSSLHSHSESFDVETKNIELDRIPRYGRYGATYFQMTLTTTLEALEARRVYPTAADCDVVLLRFATVSFLLKILGDALAYILSLSRNVQVD